MKRDLTYALNALKAGMITKIPVLLIGPPGIGKTTLARMVAAHYAGGMSHVFNATFDPGTSPQSVSGFISLPKLVNEGIIEISNARTLLDPDMTAVVIDEITRAPHLAEALLSVLAGTTRPFFATANHDPVDALTMYHPEAFQGRWAVVHLPTEPPVIPKQGTNPGVQDVAWGELAAMAEGEMDNFQAKMLRQHMVGVDLPTKAEIDAFYTILRFLSDKANAEENPTLFSPAMSQALANLTANLNLTGRTRAFFVYAVMTLAWYDRWTTLFRAERETAYRTGNWADVINRTITSNMSDLPIGMVPMWGLPMLTGIVEAVSDPTINVEAALIASLPFTDQAQDRHELMLRMLLKMISENRSAETIKSTFAWLTATQGNELFQRAMNVWTEAQQGRTAKEIAAVVPDMEPMQALAMIVDDDMLWKQFTEQFSSEPQSNASTARRRPRR